MLFKLTQLTSSKRRIYLVFNYMFNDESFMLKVRCTDIRPLGIYYNKSHAVIFSQHVYHLTEHTDIQRLVKFIQTQHLDSWYSSYTPSSGSISHGYMLYYRLINLLNINRDDLLAFLGLPQSEFAHIGITADVSDSDDVAVLMGSYARYNSMIVACWDQLQSNYDGNVDALACLDTLASCEFQS